MRNKRRNATSGAFSTFRVSEWSVRRKVVAVLAIPVILAAVFGGLRVSTELQDASTYSINQQRATVLGPAIDYLTATERLALPASLSDQLGTERGDDADAAYTTAADTLKRSAAAADLTVEQQQLVTDMMQIGATLESGGGVGITATVPVQLSSMTRLTNQLISSTLDTQGTPDPLVQGLTQSLNGRLSLVKQQLLIQSSARQPSLLGSVWLAAEIGIEGSALDNLREVDGGRRVTSLKAANGARLGEATSSKIEDLVAKPKLFMVYDGLNRHLMDDIGTNLAASASSTKSRALTDAGIILTALLASLLLGLFVARALIVPLRQLRAGALGVANVTLPETVARIRNGQEPDEITPIPVHSHEELGQLARAVDDMHKQAVTLATGEAQLRSQVGAMFVTLSRRNTTLVNQQLALIESLEQDEEDPQRLEQLFSLDHLATRMRRTAESLVILGGTGGRTAGFEELSVSDVVHAAVSEVQDYQRVRIDAAPDRMVSGRAASDLVHLMAELIDNALSYSPPGSPVTIQAAEDDNTVEIQVIDNGLGMAGDALAQANDSLKKGGEVTIDTARRMGLFVVSRLAEEHGLTVKLRRNSNGGGIIASIILPAAVLVSNGPVEHVSIIDAPQEAKEPVAPVVEEPDEEYDPYLERIEEAIAAVTGLPRRRPGQVPGPATQVPAASVGMFDAADAARGAELPAGFEPTELPSLEETRAVPVSAESEPVAVATAEDVRTEDREDLDIEDRDHDRDEPVAEDAAGESLAQVVTPDFGAERHEPVLHAAATEEPGQDVESLEDLEVVEDVEDPEPVGEAEPVWNDEPVAEAEPDWTPAPVADAQPVAVTAPEDTELVEPTGHEETVPASSWAHADDGWAAAAVSDAFGEAAPGAEAEQPPSPEEEAPVRLQIRRPLTAAAASPLEGDFVADHDDSDDSTIFGQLRSNWLSDEEQEEDQPWVGNEVDSGWDAAERAESTDTESTTRAGLPVRRPGGRLVPGGVSQEPAKVVRDPEVIRNRLAAHAAGVSRGRAAAAAEPFPDEYAHEETGPA